MTRPHRPVPATDKVPTGAEPVPLEESPVNRPGPDPDTDGDPVET